MMHHAYSIEHNIAQYATELKILYYYEYHLFICSS